MRPALLGILKRHGTIGVFEDYFGDTVIDPVKWGQSVGVDWSVAESGGSCNFVTDGAYSGSLNRSNIFSPNDFNFTNKFVELGFSSLIGDTGVSGGSILFVRDQLNFANFVSIAVDQGFMFFEYVDGVGGSVFFNMPYTAHTRWKIFHDSLVNKWRLYTYTGGVWTQRLLSPASSWQPIKSRIEPGAYIYGVNAINKTFAIDYITTDIPYA